MTTRTGRLYGFDNPCPKCGVLVGEHLWNGDCPKAPEPKTGETSAVAELVARLRLGGPNASEVADQAADLIESLRTETIEECARVADTVMKARALGNEFVEPGYAIRELSKTQEVEQ